MSSLSGFPPIANRQATLLILGSMPSDMSLLKQQYYGHQRNAFWPIMLSIFNNSLDIACYEQRKKLMMKNNIAIWDVLQSCIREGSLDAAIKMNSIKTNDFKSFYTQYKNINKVCFNGAKAEAIYKKYVIPQIKNQCEHLEYSKLPSTSPAYAAMTVEQKTLCWSNSLS